MMNAQTNVDRLVTFPRRLRTLRFGAVMPLGSSGGTLEVLEGRVWITRAGDLDDHVVESGESFAVPSSGEALAEAWDDIGPVLVAWQPTPVTERLGAGVRSVFDRCWDIVDPARRIGAGAAAAVVALAVGAMLFGPLSDSRTRALLAPTVPHNSASARSSIGFDAGTRTGSDDVSAARARVTAQEARRRAPGPA